MAEYEQDKVKIQSPTTIPFGSMDMLIASALTLTRSSLVFEHSHPFFELHLVVEGDSVIHVGAERYEVSKGDICWINPNLRRWVEMSPNDAHKHFVIHFDFMPDTASGDAGFSGDDVISGENLTRFFYTIYQKHVWIDRNNARCERTYDFICDQLKAREFGYMLIVRNMLCSFVVSAIQSLGILNAPADSAGFWKPTNTATTVLTYIRKHFTENITIEKTAKALNISERHLTRVLNEKFGATFNSALLSYRIAYIQDRLVTSDDTLEKIAEESGFSSAAVMAGNFKKATGCAPGQYRKAMGGNG